MGHRTEIDLGDTVRDSITGFQGVVICRAKWLHGCERLTVQPRELGKGGQPHESQTFDEPQLVPVEEFLAEPGTGETGGPRPEPQLKPDPR